MNDIAAKLKPYAAAITGTVLALSLFGFSMPPRLNPAERAQLACQFQFARHQIPEPVGRPYQSVRQVHPSLKRIDAWVSGIGAAIALCDMDGDGLANDCLQVDPRVDQVRVGPCPGTGNRYEWFTLAPLGLPYKPRTMAPMGCLAGDFNEDGRMDVVVYFWGRTPIVYLRKADADIAHPRPASFVAQEIAPGSAIWNTGAAMQADLDGDGHLDLVFGNYYQDGEPVLDPDSTGSLTLHDTKSRSFNGGRKHVFLWEKASSGPSPTAQFKEVESVFPEHVSRGWTLAQGAADLDGDLMPEIYFAHDLGPDRLLHNESTPGNLKFSLVEGKRDFTTPSSFVLGRDSYKGMGTDFGDLNGDGKFDIYVSNIACPYGLEESHFLWLSNSAQSLASGAAYVQASESLGLSRSGWGWDCRLADFNNDGRLEAMQATGFIKGTVNRWPELQALGTSNSEMLQDPRNWPSFVCGDDVSGHEANAFFACASDGRYYNVASDIGVGDRTLSRGIAIADVDGDGDLDFVVANQWEPSYFFSNESKKQGQYLGLHLVFDRSQGKGASTKVYEGHPKPGEFYSPAVGATVTLVTKGGARPIAQVDGGSGHSGKRSFDVHFGLGSGDKGSKAEIEIRWRDGKGKPCQTRLALVPGWHTVALGASPAGGGQ